jgi:hypothetical protein
MHDPMTKAFDNEDFERRLVYRYPPTKHQLGLLIGMSPNGGGFNNYVSKLVTLGLAKREGNEVVLQEMK